MVLTRSATAKLAAAKNVPVTRLVNYSSSEDDSPSNSSCSDMDIESDSDSTISVCSQSESDISTDDYDHVESESEKPALYDYLMEAFCSEDWLNSRFHDRMIDLYIRPLLSFNASGSSSVTQHIHDITDSRKVSVENVGNKVQVCPLCNLTKTTSRRITITDESGHSHHMEVGRHCADRYMAVVSFYKKMDKFFEDEQNRVLECLNRNLCNLEDAMRRGPNPLLLE